MFQLERFECFELPYLPPALLPLRYVRVIIQNVASHATLWEHRSRDALQYLERHLLVLRQMSIPRTDLHESSLGDLVIGSPRQFSARKPINTRLTWAANPEAVMRGRRIMRLLIGGYNPFMYLVLSALSTHTD